MKFLENCRIRNQRSQKPIKTYFYRKFRLRYERNPRSNFYKGGRSPGSWRFFFLPGDFPSLVAVECRIALFYERCWQLSQLGARCFEHEIVYATSSIPLLFNSVVINSAVFLFSRPIQLLYCLFM